MNKDTEGYEIPIATSNAEIDYENLPLNARSKPDLEESLPHHHNSDKRSTLEKINSDSGSPSDDEVEKRKTSSVVNPNYQWLTDDDIHESSPVDYENIGLESDTTTLTFIKDQIFNSVIKANGQCKQTKVSERTYSEPDSGVGIEVGVDNLLYHKIGPERNV